MTEDKYMPAIKEVWAMRVRNLELKGKGRQREMEAYLQGVLAALTATGVMDMTRAGQIGFLVAVGRGEEFLKVAK